MSLSASSTEGSQGCIDNNINDELDEVEKEDDLERVESMKKATCRSPRPVAPKANHSMKTR